MRKADLALVTCALLLAGCLEQLGDLDKVRQINWNPKLAFPIANSTFGFEDFVSAGSDTEDFVDVDPNGLIILRYENDTLFSQDAASYVELPDEMYSDSYSISAGSVAQLPIALEITETKRFDFTVENEEGDLIDSVFVKDGVLQLTVTADFPASGNAQITFQSLFEDGDPVSINYAWTYTGILPALDEVSLIDLSGLRMDLTEGGTTSNSFIADLELTLFYENEPVTTSDEMAMTFELLNATYDAAYGQFATRPINSDPETIDLPFFENLVDGTFRLEEPRIEFSFGNSFGIPISVDLSSLTAHNSTSTVEISGSIVDNEQTILAPTLAQIGDTIYSSIVVDHINSNLPDLLALLPTAMDYQLEGTINPQSSQDPGFVLEESIIDIGLEVELRLIGSLNGLTAEQTFEFDGSSLVENIDFALFQVFTNNGFPISLDVEVFFEDLNGNVLEVLVDGGPQVMGAAPVDGAGLVTEKNENTVQYILEEAKLINIRNSEMIRVRAVVNTTNDGSTTIQILDSYELHIKLGLQTEFDFNANTAN